MLVSAGGKRASQDNRDFDRVVLEAIDEGFSVLGEGFRQAIYRYLETRKGLRREGLPNSFDEFSKALEGILGRSAHLLEKIILNRLYVRLGLEFKEGEGLSFKDYVDNARRAVNER